MRKRFTAGHLAAAASAAAFLVHTAGAQAALRVPAVAGPPVLVDGRFSPGEWAGARAVPIASGDTLLLRQAQGHVFIGVRTARPYPTYVDIFLQDGEGRVYNLHASMQTGERELTDTLWTDTRPATRWGNENGWIANVSKRVPERLQDRTMPTPKEFFFPSEGREFQLLRSRFRGERWNVRVEVRDLGGGGAPDVVYPARSSRDQPAGWAVLDLRAQRGAGAHGRSLVAVQNGPPPHRVVRLDLSADGDSIRHAEVLLRAIPRSTSRRWAPWPTAGSTWSRTASGAASGTGACRRRRRWPGR